MRELVAELAHRLCWPFLKSITFRVSEDSRSGKSQDAPLLLPRNRQFTEPLQASVWGPGCKDAPLNRKFTIMNVTLDASVLMVQSPVRRVLPKLRQID